VYSGGSWVAVSGGGGGRGGGSNLLVWDGSAYPDRPSGGGSYVFVGPMAPTDIDVANGDVWISDEPDPAATETVAGVAEIATQVETNTGTADARIVTPLKMRIFYSEASDPARGSALVGHDGETVRSAIIDVRQTVLSAS
jgi:hypothetical protein